MIHWSSWLCGWWSVCPTVICKLDWMLLFLQTNVRRTQRQSDRRRRPVSLAVTGRGTARHRALWPRRRPYDVSRRRLQQRRAPTVSLCTGHTRPTSTCCRRVPPTAAASCVRTAFNYRITWYSDPLPVTWRRPTPSPRCKTRQRWAEVWCGMTVRGSTRDKRQPSFSSRSSSSRRPHSSSVQDSTLHHTHRRHHRRRRMASTHLLSNSISNNNTSSLPAIRYRTATTWSAATRAGCCTDSIRERRSDRRDPYRASTTRRPGTAASPAVWSATRRRLWPDEPLWSTGLSRPLPPARSSELESTPWTIHRWISPHCHSRQPLDTANRTTDVTTDTSCCIAVRIMQNLTL